MNQFVKFSLKSRPLPEKLSLYKYPAVARGRGLVHIYTGDEKSNTTAAMGTILQALEHGLKVYISFFTGRDYPFDEYSILNQLSDIVVADLGQNELIDPANIKLEQIAQARQALTTAREAMLSRQYEVVILNGILLAVDFKLLGMDDVIHLIGEKPANVELVLTGRQSNPDLIAMADTVTEITAIKRNDDSLG
jgi:cob(I)alamin adenosyltransferase